MIHHKVPSFYKKIPQFIGGFSFKILMETKISLIVKGAIISYLIKFLYFLFSMKMEEIKNVVLIIISLLSKMGDSYGFKRGSHIICLLCLMISHINPLYELEYFCLFILVCMDSKDVLYHDKEYFFIFATAHLSLYFICNSIILFWNITFEVEL